MSNEMFLTLMASIHCNTCKENSRCSAMKVPERCSTVWLAAIKLDNKKINKDKYLIGQRVILNDNEIGTIVVSETGEMPFDVWVHSPKKGHASCYAFCNVKPLPAGEL